MKFRAVFFVFCLSVVFFAEGGEMRKWTDVQGRQVEAEMTGFADGFVLLKLASGGETRFPFLRLSENDRGYVRENAPVNPATAARQIDEMVFEKLKSANADIKAKKAAVLADAKLTEEDRRKEFARLDFMEKMTYPTPKTSDEQFVRRIYLDIAGRIPTYGETTDFLRDSAKDKRSKLIDKLLSSEAFVSHHFNYFSDLLRVRDGLSMEGFQNLKTTAYADWIKDQIRRNRPWNEMVAEMITASGYFWDNPATGYLLTDFGMELCNLSNTFTIFAGTEITCAQCHDHPFEEVYQMDFYRMAAYFGNLRFDVKPDPQKLAAIAAKQKQFAEEAKAAKKDIRGLGNLFSAYNLAVGDGTENRTKLPFDYKYDDGEPNQPIQPAAWFGDVPALEKFPTARAAFAEWLTSEKNPRFTVNIVNRMWKRTFGYAQIEPVDNIPGHLDGQAQNYELLKFLESLMKELNYSIRDFLSVLYKTETYQRESLKFSPTLEMVDQGEFHFPAPVLRRMTAEQMWDSFVAIAVTEPEAEERRTRVLDKYRQLMNSDWSEMDLARAEALQDQISRLGRIDLEMEARDKEAGKKKINGPLMVRASELPQPSPAGSFLYSFGQSDKRFIENGSVDGSIPQVMLLLNGSLTNQIMTGKSLAVSSSAQAEGDHDEGIDTVFLSILNRRPRPQERDAMEKLVRGGKSESADYSDLIWTLLNSHEFMFVQ